MRKLLSISLLVFVMALLVVSCSPESKTLDEGLALISFSTDGGETRSLTKTDPVLNPDDFYWYYEATKTDGTGLVTGVTDGPTPVDTTDKGLNETVGPFSYGEWSFTLYAYAGENRPEISDKTAPKTNLAYTGSASKIISKTSDTLEVVVASKQTKGETVKGTLLFPVKTAMIEQTLNDAKTTTSIDYSKLIEKITVTCVDGSGNFHVNITSEGSTTSTKIEKGNNSPAKDFYEYSISKNVTKNDETVAKRYFELEPGSYSVKFSYYQNAKVKSAGNGIEVAEGKSEYILVAEETIYVAVADYLTTEIGGTIASNEGSVKITVKNGVTAVTISQTIKNNSDTVFDSADSADDTARSSGYKVSIPAGGLKGTSAVLDSEIYSPEVASEKNADYLFESGGAVIGGESSTLYEDNSSEETKTFGFANDTEAGSSTNKARRVTKTITLAKNLNDGKYYINTDVYTNNNGSYTNLPETLPGNAEVVTGTDSVPDCDIVPKYQGDKTDYTSEKGYDIPNGVICYYNPASGLTVYQVEHFSTYFFKSKTAVYYDVENRKAYATLKEAIEDTDTKKSGTLILLADTTETVTGEKGLEIKKALTLNLNGHTLTLSDTAKDGETAAGRIFTITAPFTVKNGTIKGSVKCSVFRAETNGNLTLDKIEANVDSSDAVVTSGGTTYKGAAAGKTLVFLYQGSNPVYATIRNSNLEFIGTYCIGSNAANTTNGVSYINLTIENSTITAKNDSLDDNKDEDHTTGLLANVPGTVIIKNSVISGSRQGAILRGGTYTINGSTFKSTGSTTITTYDERDWSTGNGVPAAALVVGNRSKSYAYPTEVTFEGTNTLVNTDATRKQIYIYKADEVEGDADVDRSVTVEGFNEDWSVNNNFNGAVVKSGTTLLVNDGETLKSAISCVAKGETIKFTNDITCTLSDTNSSDGCDTSLWFESENVTMDFNSKKLVVRSNYGGSLNIINAFGAGCTFKNGEIFVYRKTNGGTVSNGSYGYDATYPCWDSYALGVEFEETGNCTIENMTLHGGIAIYGNVNATIKKGTYADATNYYALHAEENCTATVEECTFNGAEGSGIIFEMLHSGCSVTVKSGTYTGKDLLGGKGSLSITGGTFSSDPTSFVDTNTYTVTPDSTKSPTSWTVSEKANGK